MNKERRTNHAEEIFFLNNFNIDHIFNTIERADYLFLYYIKVCMDNSDNNDRVYLSVLSDTMNISIPETSRAVERLQDKGYVLWKTDNAAGKTYVRLSSKAIELMRDENLKMQKVYKKIEEEISEEELSQMTATMKKITDILKETINTPNSPDIT